MAQSLKPREHHPRVCGEKQKSGIFPFRLVGSPPRMRGKAFLCVAQAFAGGITPAYAGKRLAFLESTAIMQDHPRVCGEKSQFVVIAPRYMGSPPRMRGKVFPPYSPAWKYRITPAYAGKSSLPFPPRKCCRDHPRVCGEKCRNPIIAQAEGGSPPRMRGKVPCVLFFGVGIGITPAYAGKRGHRRTRQKLAWDHPRVCGEKKPQIRA